MLVWLRFEFLLLFVGLPLAYRMSPWRLPALPVLWAAALYCAWVLHARMGAGRADLWDPQKMDGRWRGMLLLFAVSAVAIAALVRWRAPQLLFSLMRQHPALWGLVLLLYPLLSVYPQGVVYRLFLFRRYAPLVEGDPRALILLSAACFSFMHIVFRNPIAVVLTFAGGLVFAWRYAETGSLIGSSVEHALYGCWMFTVGLGAYFYEGAQRATPLIGGR